jgi:DNA polymerase-3 subunit epsilon
VIALDKPMRGAPVVVLDLESTGFETSARIVEVALVCIERFGETDCEPTLLYATLVDPEMEIPWAATRVHGIRDHDVRGKPTWSQVWPVVLEHLQGRVPVAHGYGYDLRVLQAEADNVGAEGPPPKEAWIDTMTLSKRIDPEADSHKLGPCCARYGLPQGTHRAESDARCTARLLSKLLWKLYAKEETRNRLSPPLRPTVRQLLWWLHATKKERLRAAPPPPAQAALPVRRASQVELAAVQVAPLPPPPPPARALVVGTGPYAAPLPLRLDRSLVVSLSSLPAPEQQIVRITSEIMTGLPWCREGRYGQRTTVQLAGGSFRWGFLCPPDFQPGPGSSCVVFDGLEVVVDYVDGAANVVIDERGKAQLRRSDKGDGGWNLHSHVPDAQRRIRSPQQAEADRAQAEALHQAELERREAERAEHDRKRAWAQRRAQGCGR